MASSDLSPLAKIIAAEPPAFTVWPVSGFFRGPGAEVLKIAIVLLTPLDDEHVIIYAAKHRAEQAKKAAAGEADVMGDARMLDNAEAVEALFLACHEVGPDGKPSPFHSFPGADWMRAHLRADQWGALHALYVATKRQHRLQPAVSSEVIEDRLAGLAARGQTPEVMMADWDRGDLVNVVSVVADMAIRDRHAAELALADRDAAEKERDELRAKLVALEAADEAKAEPDG